MKLVLPRAATLLVAATCWVMADFSGLLRLNHEPDFSLIRKCGGLIATAAEVPFDPRFRSIPVPFGVYDLWRGEVWRLLVSPFLHGSLTHLLTNIFAWCLFGTLLERRIGTLGVLCLLPGALVIPMALETWSGYGVIGLSGLISAVIGALFALAQAHPDSQSNLRLWVWLGSLGILFSVVTTQLQLDQSAAVAHLTGWIYGWGYTWAVYGPFPSRGAIRVCVALAHFGVLPIVYLAVNPIWLPQYLWYEALRTDAAPKARDLLQRSIRIQPDFTLGWYELARLEDREQGALAGWNIAVQALAANPTDDACWAELQRRWRELPLNGDREQALETLHRAVGRGAQEWEQRIRFPTPPRPWLADPPNTEQAPSSEVDLQQRWTTPLRLHEEPAPVLNRPARPVPPAWPGATNASEGETL